MMLVEHYQVLVAGKILVAPSQEGKEELRAFLAEASQEQMEVLQGVVTFPVGENRGTPEVAAYECIVR